MKWKRLIAGVITALLFAVPAVILTASFSSCGQGPAVSVARPYASVVDLLTPDQRYVVGLRRNEQKKEAVIIFWQQAIWWKGLRYRIAVRSVDPATTELRGWVCDDNSLMPGCNVFTKRPLVEQSFHDLLERAEHRRSIREKLKAQQSAAPLPSAPAGPSVDVR